MCIKIFFLNIRGNLLKIDVETKKSRSFLSTYCFAWSMAVSIRLFHCDAKRSGAATLARYANLSNFCSVFYPVNGAPSIWCLRNSSAPKCDEGGPGSKIVRRGPDVVKKTNTFRSRRRPQSASDCGKKLGRDFFPDNKGQAGELW